MNPGYGLISNDSSGAMKWSSETVTIIVSIALFAFFSFLVALVTLCCADHKHNNSSASSAKAAQSPEGKIGGSEQTEIVVIMAGDEHPTHLAKLAAPPASSCTPLPL
ncbi:unnamed protein product [Linum trigynum]|uniref:Uncharacterized protein n=2 Tax=Linum trigynum TaxID=586398 RepID=A0AAV2G066_9ROSI